MDKFLSTIQDVTCDKSSKNYKLGGMWVFNKECVIEIPEGHVVAKVKKNFSNIITEGPSIVKEMREMAGRYHTFERSSERPDCYYGRDSNNKNTYRWLFHKDWLEFIPNPNTKGPASPSATETMKEITATLDLSTFTYSVIVRDKRMYFKNGSIYRCPWGGPVLNEPGRTSDVIYNFDNGTDVFETLTAGRCLDKYKVVRASVEAEVRKLLEQGKIVARDCDGTKRLLELDDDGKVYGYTSNGDRSWCTFSNEKSKYYTFTNSVEMVKWLSKRS